MQYFLLTFRCGYCKTRNISFVLHSFTYKIGTIPYIGSCEGCVIINPEQHNTWCFMSLQEVGLHIAMFRIMFFTSREYKIQPHLQYTHTHTHGEAENWKKYLYGCQSQQLAELHMELLKRRAGAVTQDMSAERVRMRLITSASCAHTCCRQPLRLAPPTWPRHRWLKMSQFLKDIL